MKANGGMEVHLHSFLTSAIDKYGWSTSCPSYFAPRKSLDFPLNRKPGWPQSKSGSFMVERKLLLLPEIKPKLLGHLAHTN
jgi:hypothetical protein